VGVVLKEGRWLTGIPGSVRISFTRSPGKRWGLVRD